MEQLLLDTLHSRDEIDTFLKNKVNTKTVHASGAFKILETMAFAKEAADPVNYDSLLKLVDKRIENEMPRTAKKKDLIHEITRNIFSKVQKAQQKKVKDGKVFTAEYYQKKLQKIDLDMITVEKEVQTEDEEDIFRRKSMAVRKMMKNNEINNYTKDLEAYNEEILRKCRAFELQKNTLENDKNEALMQIKQTELKLKLKKEKNTSLKKLIQELRDKLLELSERESHALNLFQNKEKECALLLIKQEELQQMFTVQLKDMTEKRDFLDKKVKENHYSRINSRFDENYSPSNSPLHRNESKAVIDSDSQKSNQIIKEKDKSKKKQSLKRKRASTMDVKILNRLTQKPNSPLNGRKPQTEQKEQSKTTPRKISEKPESHERMSIMTRSRSVFVAVTKPKTSIKGLQKPEISTHPDPQPRVSLPQNFNVSDSKSFIESNSSEKKLETLEEMSKDGQNSPIMEAMNASFERDSIMFQGQNGKKLLLDENTSVEFQEFPQVARDKKNIQTKEIACQIKPEKKEQESMAYFVDKAELYVQKLQKMVDQNNQNMRYILERIFLNRNHQTFIEDLVNFLKNCSFKKIDRFTQTEDFLISIRPLSLNKSASKPSDRKIMSMSQTAKNEGISTRREDLSEFYEMHPETYDINPKSQKSQSQHVTRTNFNLNVSVKQKNDPNEAKKENYYQTNLNEKTNRTEKPQIPSNFLFNKAIKGDLFGELNKINRVQSQEISKRNKNTYEKISRNVPIYDDFLMKIDIDREREENQEREKLIKRLSQHITEMKEQKEENFAKIKYFFKYPFKTVRELVDNEPEVGIDDGRIEQLVSKFVNRHRVCGVNCEHLRRFYKRIGFINLQINRKEAMVHKHFINKLPTVEDNL